ncbi:MAG: hypothetical protein RLZZ524_2343 [Pseudomonadota bacterium]
MKSPAAKWKAAERARRADAGLVPVTVYVYPQTRAALRAYVKRLNARSQPKEN